MGGVLRNKKCFGLVKDLKLSASSFINEANLFSSFSGWQNGYAAFTYSIDAKKNLVDYALNQEAHHKKISFEDELIQLLNEHQIEFDEKYLL